MSERLLFLTRREALWLGVGALVLITTVLLLPNLVNGSAFPAVCEQELSAQWKTVGVVDAPGLDHYDVRCQRDSGLFASETKWVTVPRSEYTFTTGWERTVRFYRGVLGL